MKIEDWWKFIYTFWTMDIVGNIVHIICILSYIVSVFMQFKRTVLNTFAFFEIEFYLVLEDFWRWITLTIAEGHKGSNHFIHCKMKYEKMCLAECATKMLMKN